METEHTETVVDKAVAFVKDMLGMPPADKPPDVVAKPEYTDTAPELTTEGAMRLDPHAYAFNKIVERSRRSTDTEHETNAAAAHNQAAQTLDPADGSVQSALDESERPEAAERANIAEGALNPAVLIAAIPML